MTAVVGLDLSLTATGIFGVLGASVADSEFPDYQVITSKKKGMERLDEISEAIWARTHYADLIVIEGYSMGTARQASHAHALGELGGVVRHNLWSSNRVYVDVPPASLKKFATGKGNASKEDVTGAAIRAGCPSNDNNVCDAFWLRQMGLYHLHRPGTANEYHCDNVVPHTAYRDDAIAKIAWPEMTA